MFKLFGVGGGNENDYEPLDEDIKENENNIGQVALDVIEKDDSITIIAPIAGIDLKDIDLTIKSSVLQITGKRKKPDIYYEKGILRNNECFWGEFIRNIILPENLDSNHIKAILENNLLIIHIPKLTLNTKNIKIDKITD
ncbi:MAG: Hsp20/alpha crystallin family protein [Candidatus Gracilibacteria bacterium]|nr:Hsp20/alpha crystallin family protein [Candidatus Gracilibacteria bacterium]